MSTETRKITHFTIEMVNGDQYLFNGALFRDFMFSLLDLPKVERIERIKKQNKALLISFVSEYTTTDHMHILNVAFSSCKYNHAPDYMSSTSGEERATTKQKDEGEEETTHFAVKITNNEGYVVLEDRRSGVSIGTIVNYLSSRFVHYQVINKMESRYKLQYSIVPQDDFLEMLGKCEKVCSAELFVEKQLLGSEYLNFAEIPLSLRDEMVIYMAPERGKSIETSFVTSALNKLVGGPVKRIRVRVKDDGGRFSILDTLYGKRKDEVTAELNDNGTVNSTSMFNALKEVLTEDESET